jgi:subtilisin family serine protease
MKRFVMPAFGLLLAALPAPAATVAIVDSGTDFQHPALADKKWINDDAEDRVDNDRNGFVDDSHGWNFAENNNQLIDRSHAGTFSPDVKKYFDLQKKLLDGTITPEEREWMKQKRSDEKFLAELNRFGSWVHGTHVAGIAAADLREARIMGVKLLPTPAKQTFQSAIHEIRSRRSFLQNPIQDMLVKAGLAQLARQQGRIFTPIGAYVKVERAAVANCSFGTSFTAVQPLLKQLIEGILRREPTQAELENYAKHFVGEVVKTQTAWVQSAPETLFVMAAGNDGTDNDTLPTSPANVRQPNSITVAATHNNEKLASFSNFGATMVDVGAPGVGILSAIPGGEQMLLSGTSQAAPYVAGVAGQVLEANPKLGPAQVREVLMKTVDAKPWLAGKVVSGGVVNPERAVRAAELSRSAPLAQAIASAQAQVADALPAPAPAVAGLLVPLVETFR